MFIVFIFLVDERLGEAVDVATMLAYMYTVSSPQHSHCRLVIFIANYILIRSPLLWIYSRPLQPMREYCSSDVFTGRIGVYTCILAVVDLVIAEC